MPERLEHVPLFWWPLALCLGISLLGCNPTVGQTNVSPSVPSGRAPQNEQKAKLKGCVYGGPDQFFLATDESAQSFALTGKTSALEKFRDKEITVEGDGTGPPIPVDGYFEPFPSFQVNRIVGVSPQREPSLSASFSNISAWRAERNEKYGVEFAHPESMISAPDHSPTPEPNFVTGENVQALSTFTIPRDTYSDANLLAGSFSIFVNGNIRNAESCREFGSAGPQELPVSPLMVGKLEYAAMEGGGAAAGTWYSDYYFHIFQNGMCYEVAFELVEYNAHNATTACNVPLLSQKDNMNLINPLLAKVSFFQPTVPSLKERDPNAVPRVTGFSASSEIADGRTNRGQITFSWTTQDAEYVEFTYTCVVPDETAQGGILSVVISENGPNRYCQNIPSFKRYSAGHFYHSPNSSEVMGFGYFDHDDPTSVTVTITPFTHGAAYPASSKSLTIAISPYKPFPLGVPVDTRNMTLAYTPAAEGTQGYQQGSTLSITWTDTRIQDPCVILYLVQDNGRDGGEDYLLQINGKREIGCLRPSRSGSYTWLVTSRYSGSGFRVLARTPGGTSGTLGAPFTIIKSTPSSR
jgi:hypothetical protein